MLDQVPGFDSFFKEIILGDPAPFSNNFSDFNPPFPESSAVSVEPFLVVPFSPNCSGNVEPISSEVIFTAD